MADKILTGLLMVFLVAAASGCSSREDIPEAADSKSPPPIYVTAPAVPSPPPPLPEKTPGTGSFLRPGRTAGAGGPSAAAGNGSPQTAEPPAAAVPAGASTPPAPAAPGGAVFSIGNKDFFGSIHEASGAKPSQVSASPAASPVAGRPGQTAPPAAGSAPPPAAGQGTDIEQKALPKIQRHRK